MSSYYIRDCGHTTLRDAWENAPDEHLSGICSECRIARIGEIIEFIRHGDIPQSGSSFNFRDQSSEKGISVYELKNGIPAYVGWYFDIAQRPAKFGRGRIVGWGSDGEPLVEIHDLRT